MSFLGHLSTTIDLWSKKFLQITWSACTSIQGYMVMTIWSWSWTRWVCGGCNRRWPSLPPWRRPRTASVLVRMQQQGLARIAAWIWVTWKVFLRGLCNISFEISVYNKEQNKPNYLALYDMKWVLFKWLWYLTKIGTPKGTVCIKNTT